MKYEYFNHNTSRSETPKEVRNAILRAYPQIMHQSISNSFEMYNEPHRYYHNWSHIVNMITSAINKGIASDNLITAILFHDLYSDPKVNDNEEQSKNLFYAFALKNGKNEKEIATAILDTIHHKPSKNNETSKQLCMLDCEILHGSISDFAQYEEKIFKEYQFHHYDDYIEGRILALTKLKTKESLVNYVRERRPKIAIYAGSFNPFHVGHYNILKKADAIFDKVIIAQGKNIDKDLSVQWNLPDILNYRQIIIYDGLLTDCIKSLNHDVTLIRGLRNEADLRYELNQYRVMQDLFPELKMVNIFCDREFEHVSSKAIRTLANYTQDFSHYLKFGK